MLKIVTAQLKVQPGHPSENTENMLTMIAQGRFDYLSRDGCARLSFRGYLGAICFLEGL